MEQDACNKPSRVPHHLRPFQRPSLIVEPELTADNTLALDTSPPQPVELCPPHWRLPAKRGLRETLKGILLKEWLKSAPRTPPRCRSCDRPSMMRMKDSDDYITARAANPRTGLISPSVGTLTPRLPDTPDSPGEALHLKTKASDTSPTPDCQQRPGLKRANEGRKISSNIKRLWKADANGWLMDGSAATASPRVTTAEIEGMVSSDSHPHLNEDTLVIHMPSAQEPQPYAYPGYSAKQIEAAEFYKRNSRRVSSEGYDKRILQSTRKVSSRHRPDVSGVRKVSSGKSGQNLPRCKASHCGNADSPVFYGGHITVAKRRLGPQEFHDLETTDCDGGAELHVPMFAPFSSPKTPAVRSQDEGATEMQTAHVSRHHDMSTGHHIHRKSIESSQKFSFRGTHNLKDLPRIALVHPALAALPQSHPQRQQKRQDGIRACSLGCAWDADGGVCTEQRTPLQDGRSLSSHSLFDQTMRKPDFDRTDPQDTRTNDRVNSEPATKLFDLLAASLITIVETCRHIVVPVLSRLRVIDVLRAEDRTTEQKIDALRPIVATVGQALVLLSFIAILWHVGSAVVHVFEIVLWPVIVPFRILKWIASGRG